MGNEADETPGFDAWVAGRSGALTRFAYLLTGSEITADQALSAGLTIACATWSQIRRSDDPEAHVKRLVVEAHLSPGGPLRRRRRAPVAVPTSGATAVTTARGDDATQAWRLCATLSPAQRAAVVLRCYAEMTYPQIAATIGGKEAASRAHVEQSFEALRLAIAEPRNDIEIEAAFRDAFAEHAEDTIDTGDRAALAHAGVRRRRRRQVLPAVAVVTLLVAGLAGAAISYDGGNDTTAAKPGDHPRGWRAESYNGIQLWVPSGWGWGEVPRHTRIGLVSCGLGAYSPTAVITNLRYVLRRGGAAPYVGRPVADGMTCPRSTSTSAPHVWFDSPLSVGSGPGQTTISVTGMSTFNVTVADANVTERRTILASLEQVKVDAYGCPRDAAGIREIESISRAEPSPRLVRKISLCLYGGAVGQEVLFYSTRLEGLAAREAAANIQRGPSPTLSPVCLVKPALSRAVLITRTATSPSIFVVNPGTCPQDPVGFVTGSGYHLLTEESLRVWAVDGLALYSSPDLSEQRLLPVPPSR